MDTTDTALYRRMLASSTIPLWIWDAESLRVVDANEAACALYGYTYEEIIGRLATELRPSEEIERFQKFIAENLMQGDVGTWIHKRKDGTTFPVNIRYH